MNSIAERGRRAKLMTIAMLEMQVTLIEKYYSKLNFETLDWFQQELIFEALEIKQQIQESWFLDQDSYEPLRVKCTPQERKFALGLAKLVLERRISEIEAKKLLHNEDFPFSFIDKRS